MNINRPPFSPAQADANKARAYAEAWERTKRTTVPLLVAVSLGLIIATIAHKAIANAAHMAADVAHVYALEGKQ